VPVRIRPTRASLESRASNGEAQPDNRLTALDNGLFAAQRASRQKSIMQVVWVYEHDIDFDGLKRFHHNLGYGLLGRRIERSPLSFARCRWVLDRGPSAIDIAECARPRPELSDWADERSQLPADPERGPGWHLGVLPLTDGSTGVSLVISHYILDGIGLVGALIDATGGNKRDLGYPPPRSLNRLGTLVQDARQTALDAPEVARALVTAAKQARGRRNNSARSAASGPASPRAGDGDDVVVIPFATICVDLDEFNARAKALGGTSKTLVAGFVAKLAERMGRRRAGDGTVSLRLPISERTEGDTRANAVSFAAVSVDPTRVTTDLGDVRAAIKEALSTLREAPDESLQLFWLTPFIPKRIVKRLDDGMSADPDFPVFCSNLGDVGSLVCRLDGSDAEYVTGRLTSQCLTRQRLERTGGLMTLQSWCLPDKIVITIGAYQPGAENTKPALRELAGRTLDEFDLRGKVD
jgi:hypothetical protein